MQDKKVRISVEDSKLRDLKRTTTELANDMIRSSRQYTTSSKEVLRDLEAQIKLIEKRNRLDSEQQKLGLQTRYGAGEITKSQYSTQLQNVRSGGQEDKVQVQLLKEIIDTIQRTSKEEIREDRVTVERTIRRDKSLDKLGITGSPELALKRTIQRGLLGDLGEEEVGEKQRFRNFGRGAGRAFNTASSLGTSKNEMYALAGLVGLTPIIGQGLSAVANRFLSAGETAEQSMTGWGAANMGMGYGGAARDWRGIKKSGIGRSLGLDPSEMLNRRSALMKSMGTGVGTSDFMQLMGAERFVGAGNIGQLAGVSRYGQGDMVKVLRVLEMGQRNTTRLTENIDAYVQASNTSLNISSNVNEAGLAKSIAGISRATGTSGRGLNAVTGAIQGLGNTSNPITKSLMMRAFRQANPGASMFDIQAMMEDPLANLQNGGGQFFENLKGMTGGGETYKQVLYSTFRGDLSKSRINEILNGGGDFTEIAREAQAAKEGDINFKGLGEKTTGIGARATAGADAFFQEYGLKMLETAEKTVESIKSLYDRLSDDNKESKTYLEKQNELMEERITQAAEFEKAREEKGGAMNLVPNPYNSMSPKF